MPDPREPIVTHAERYMAVPGDHGACRICEHDYGAHYTAYDALTAGCSEYSEQGGYPCFCEGYASN
jgi:hypothetical protein